MTSLIFLEFWSHFNEKPPITRFQEESNEMPKGIATKQNPPLITNLNIKNSLVKTVVCDDVDIKIWEDGHRHRLNGRLAYRKPNDFHLEMSSPLGKEVEIGSNKDEFWYWSKHDKNPGLHYARQADFAKSRLKTPFDPNLIKACLGQEVLETDNAKFTESEKDIMVTYEKPGSAGKPVFLSFLVNRERIQIDGFVAADSFGKYLVSCEIQEWRGDLPSVILYTWYEEDRILLLKLNNPRSNVSVEDGRFVMPNYRPKINITGQ